MNNKSFLLLFLAFALASFGADAQMTSLEIDSLLTGTWQGSSICQLKNSPCHDETVVYHISRVSGNDTLFIQADKIVNGIAVDMGILPCLFDEKTNSLVSSSYGTWSFLVRDNEMEGTLIYNGELYRKITLSKTH